MKRQERLFPIRSFASRPLPLRSLLSLLLLISLLFSAGDWARADDLTRQVQEELRKRNLYFGDVDGRRTPEVVAALRHYQMRKGFSASGETDDQTLRSLSLQMPLAMSFAPPAAAVAVSNPNPVANGPMSTNPTGPPLQETTVPYWPDITVLRSDQGRHGSPGAADFDQASGVVPGMADQISPPAKFNAVPPPSSASNEHPTAAEVRDFITRYLHAGQTNEPDVELAFYADQVKYFNEGTVDRHFIAQDIRRYEKHWPERAFTIVGPISVVADANNFDHTLVHFHYQFTNKNSHFTVNGETDNLYTLAGTGLDSLRIIAIRERRVR